jgi:hypothetical protein
LDPYLNLIVSRFSQYRSTIEPKEVIGPAHPGRTAAATALATREVRATECHGAVSTCSSSGGRTTIDQAILRDYFASPEAEAPGGRAKAAKTDETIRQIVVDLGFLIEREALQARRPAIS